MRNKDTNRLLRLMSDHGIGEFNYADSEGEIALSISAGLQLHPQVRCPQAAEFLSRHPLDLRGPAFPRTVRDGEIIAYLKVGGLLLPIRASCQALLPPPTVKDGAIAGYGDVLF